MKLALAFALLLFVLPASADTIFSNLDTRTVQVAPGLVVTTDHAFGPACEAFNGGSCGVLFTAPFDFTFTGVVTAPTGALGSFRPSIDLPFFTLQTDANGLPGPILDTSVGFGQGVLNDLSPAIPISFGEQPLLHTGNEYWLILNQSAQSNPQPTFERWEANWTGDVGLVYTDNFGVQSFGIGTRPAFEIDGVPAVPEPSSLTLMGIGLMCVVFVMRHKLLESLRQ